MGLQSQTQLSHWTTTTVANSQVQWRGLLSSGLITPFAVQRVVLWHCPPSPRSPGCGLSHRPLLTRCCCFYLCGVFPAPLGGGGGVDTSEGVEGGSGKSWAWFGKGACPRLLRPAALCHSGSFNMPDAHTHSWLIASEFLGMAPSDCCVAPGRSGEFRWKWEFRAFTRLLWGFRSERQAVHTEKIRNRP